MDFGQRFESPKNEDLYTKKKTLPRGIATGNDESGILLGAVFTLKLTFDANRQIADRSWQLPKPRLHR